MESLSGHLKSIKVPCAQDNVYKDECVYSYDTPVSNLPFRVSSRRMRICFTHFRKVRPVSTLV